MRIAEKIGEDGVGVGNCVIFAHHDIGTASNHRRETLVVAFAAEETQNFLAPFRRARDFITDAEARCRDFGDDKVRRSEPIEIPVVNLARGAALATISQARRADVLGVDTPELPELLNYLSVNACVIAPAADRTGEVNRARPIGLVCRHDQRYDRQETAAQTKEFGGKEASRTRASPTGKSTR